MNRFAMDSKSNRCSGEHQREQQQQPSSSDFDFDVDEIDHDQEKDDPNLVDDVLSRELMKLSVRNRTEFQEEIHGVRCLAPTETPELLERSLKSLQWEIDRSIPVHRKEAYLQSQQLPETYVNTEAFRLRFLRCELFDAPKAAVRLTRFLDLVKDLYGDYALQRPIRLSDFSKSELKCVRKGHYQLLPYRDRGGIVGRRVLTIFPDREWELFPPYLRNKIMIYFYWTAGNDVDAQREGIVLLIWFDATAKVSRKPAIQAKVHETQTIRAAAIHCCSPDTPLYRFRRSIVTMRIGRQNRTRLVVHLGNSVEVRSKLQSYGIDHDQLPITFAGKVKSDYLKKWMKLREYIESNQWEYGGMPHLPLSPSSQIRRSMPATPGSMTPRKGSMTSVSSYASSDSSDSSFFGGALCEEGDSPRIESPFLSDIIFRKGSSLVSHPGNTNLRTIIAAKAQKELLESQQLHEQQQQQQQQEQEKQQPHRKKQQQQTRRFVSEIIRELRETSRANEAAGTGRACRFLAWEEGGWWTELFQENDIHTRIEYIVRSIRNTLSKNHRAASIASITAATATNASSASEPQERPAAGDESVTKPAAKSRREQDPLSAYCNRRGSETSATSTYNRRSSETSATSVCKTASSTASSSLARAKPALRRRNSIHNVYKRRDSETIATGSSVYSRPASETNITSALRPKGRRRNSIQNVYKPRDIDTGVASRAYRRRGSETSTVSSFKRRGSETSTASAHDVFRRRGSETSVTSVHTTTAAPAAVISFLTPPETQDIFRFSSHSEPGDVFSRDPKKRRTLRTTRETSDSVSPSSRRNSIHNESSVYSRPASETNITSALRPKGRRRNSIHNVYKPRDTETSVASRAYRRRGSESGGYTAAAGNDPRETSEDECFGMKFNCTDSDVEETVDE